MSLEFNPKKPAKRIQQPRETGIELLDDFAKLKSAIVAGKFTPQLSAEVSVVGPAYDKLKMKDPARVFMLRLKKLLHALGLEADYSVSVLKQTDKGHPVVRVTYEPPTVSRRA